MNDPENTPEPQSDSPDRIFVPAWDRYNRPARIVTLGHFYPQGQAGIAKNLLREVRVQGYQTGGEADAAKIGDHLAWTRLLQALGRERQWPLQRLFAILDPMLEPGIAIAAVPPHRAYQAFWPLRTLAQRLATNGRRDAAACLTRHTTIRRILFGGPSTRALHRQTIDVEATELIQGRRVLLLDDIAKSGASLVACREMLLEAGDSQVQALALGRVIVPHEGNG